MKPEKIEQIKSQLEQRAEGAPDMQDFHWVENEAGYASNESYCNKCAHVVVTWYNGGEKPEQANDIPDRSGGGGFYVAGPCRMEDDEPRHCDLCGAELAVSILSGDGELHHWSAHGPETPQSWRILLRLFDLYAPYLKKRLPYSWERPFGLKQNRRRAAALLLIIRRLEVTE